MTKNIFEYIKILLPRHKCVTLPGLGAFILNKEENTTFDIESSIAPPSYSITFNSRLQHDDGTLSSHIQGINGVSYEKASKDLAVAIRALRAQLLVEKEIPCSTLGKIELIESTIIFTQNKDYLFPSHYGLTPVGLTCISAISHSIEKETKTTSLTKRLVMAAASVAVVLLLALPTTNIKDSVVGNSYHAGYLHSLVTTSEENNDIAIAEQATIEDLVEIETPAIIEPTTIEIYKEAIVEKEEEVVATTVVTKPKSGKTYYLIIGGETSENRALNTLDKFRKEGFETAQILDSPQRYRIYIETFDNIGDAEKTVVKFRKENPKYESAWIHSKRN